MTPQRSLLRWAVRGVLALGVAASVIANVLHARDNPISQTIAAWPPLALLITVELVTRIPVYNKALGAIRILATIAIAGIAAWISYHHMVGVVARYGETGTVPYLLPLSVDGLIVVASICLVELSASRDQTSHPSQAAQKATSVPTAEESDEALTPSSAPGTAPPAPAHRDDGQPVPATSARPTATSGPEQTNNELPNEPPSNGKPATAGQPEPSPGPHGDDGGGNDDMDEDRDPAEGSEDESEDGVDLAHDLVPLLPAARAARDELIRDGRTVSRDALAHRMRHNGHAIRNTRVSELLNALRQEEQSRNSARTSVSA